MKKIGLTGSRYKNQEFRIQEEVFLHSRDFSKGEPIGVYCGDEVDVGHKVKASPYLIKNHLGTTIDGKGWMEGRNAYMAMHMMNDLTFEKKGCQYEVFTNVTIDGYFIISATHDIKCDKEHYMDYKGNL